MSKPATTSEVESSRNDTLVLLGIAAWLLALHVVTNNQYGFHPDELATIDDARHLAWGYVVYPPLTPALARVAMEFFGTSMRSVRLFPALAQVLGALLAGLMAREFGGKRLAQVIAACAAAIAPMALASGTLLQYVALDYLCWVATFYFLVRLLRTGHPRWWLAIGAAIGFGLMTKYSMLFLIIGVVAGMLLTDARRHLRSRWLLCGVAVSLLIFLPNLVWQLQHNFISLEFLRKIHQRDIQQGFTATFLPDQFLLSTNVVTVPLWIAGLFFFFGKGEGTSFRLIGWTVAVTFGLLMIARARGYYAMALYPVLLAGGAVLQERWLASLSVRKGFAVRATTWVLLLTGGILAASVALPLAPMRSPWWARVVRINRNFREEIGWPDLVAEVARVRDSLPPYERSSVAILANTYGEAGAINFYGPAHGLAPAISGINNYWQRGYGEPPPQVLIVLGMSAAEAGSLFDICRVAGHVTNSWRVVNDETKYHPDILVCRTLRYPWPEFWQTFRTYG